jgi:conjugal transfer pilus assembly protein TraD
MKWWDGGVRRRVSLAVVNAAVLAAAAHGAVRWAALGASAIGMLLVLRSLRFGAPSGTWTLPCVPCVPGAALIGRGFEWTVETAQDFMDGGPVAWPSDRELFLPDELLARHLLILGTTGVGKTRLLELLALQAIARGDAVVVIDPKGDEGLRARLASAAGGRWKLFSLPHPARSIRYNPVGRYREVREIADRVAALLPSSGDALPFRNFAWEIVHVAAREIHGKRPMTLRNLKQGALDRPVKPLAERPREHYLKMASALIPILSKLATEQLSPESGGLAWEEVDCERQVVYFSLGSLLGFETASAVAKMAILDLQGYIGDRMAHAKGQRPIWLFIDEMADAATVELVSLLGKRRGAGLRIIGCAQTVSDLEAALGSRARALQVVANVNTLIQFRSPGGPDAETFSDAAGSRLLRTRSESAAYEPALLGSGLKTVDDFRARFGEILGWSERPLVPSWAVVQLPIFHFFARLSEGRVYRGRVPLLA